MTELGGGLHTGFLRSYAAFPDRPALEVEGETLTYRALHDRACAIAAALDRAALPDEPPLTAVFAHRSVTAFAGVLGALFRGHGYVPLNRTFPPARTAAMLRRSGCRAVIVDAESATQLDAVIEGITTPLTLVLPDVADVSAVRRRWPQHQVLGSGELVARSDWTPVSANGDAIAYLLFTSGSTGTPKGVMVAHRNVRRFVDVMVDRYGIDETDRFSQTFDLTFDLSAFDMFVAWERGACVCCLPQSALMHPARFIREGRLTVWFSVPSLGILMQRLGLLKEGRYPDLRWSLFCGEPLPVEIAAAWAAAAPNATLENLYGPTELTIACMVYPWDAERGPRESRHGIVPIGHPFPGMSMLVVDDQLQPVAPGGEGELLLTGPQVTLGYWEDPERTSSAFVRPSGPDLYYRTGDLVRVPVDEEPVLFLGRIDHQIKVNGHRVELGEVEAQLRAASGSTDVVALGWPRTASGASGVVGFVCGDQTDVDAIRTAVADKLPEYMVPRRIYVLDELPLNVNGKYDRNALLRLLEESA